MAWDDLSNRWQEYFIKELHLIASMSKDVDTKVGAIIIDTEEKLLWLKVTMICQEEFSTRLNVTVDH